MKRLLAVMLFALASARAEFLISQRNFSNLSGVTFCIDKNRILTADALHDTVNRDFSITQYNVLKTKLTAYRIPFVELCTFGTNEFRIWVNLNATSPLGSTNARMFEIDLYVMADVSQFKESVVPYSIDAAGTTTNYSDNELKEYLSAKWATLIDSFAADYAKANP